MSHENESFSPGSGYKKIWIACILVSAVIWITGHLILKNSDVKPRGKASCNGNILCHS